MAVTANNGGRQYPLVAVEPATFANLGAGNEITFYVPPGAFLVDIDFILTAVFAGGTVSAASVSVSDGTTTFISAETVFTGATLGPVAVDTNFKYFPSGATITVSFAQTGSGATTGAGYAILTYIQLNRTNEIVKS